MPKRRSTDEWIDHLWQYWLPQAIVKASQLAPDDPTLKTSIVDELRRRHRDQVVLLRQERVPWGHLSYYKRWYTNPFLMDDERADLVRRAHVINHKRQRKELAPYVAEYIRSNREQGSVGSRTGEDNPR